MRLIIRTVSILLLVLLLFNFATVLATSDTNVENNEDNGGIFDIIKNIPSKLESIFETLTNLPDKILNGIAEWIRGKIADSLFFYIDKMVEYVSEKIKSEDIIFINGDLNDLINKITNITKPIAYSLVALFFVISMLKSSIYLEVMTLEGFIKPILMFIAGKTAIDFSYTAMKAISDINTTLSNTILSLGTLGEAKLKESVIAYIGNTAALNVLIQILIFALIGLILLLFLIAIGILLAIRQFEMAVMTCLAPIFFATLCGGFTDVFKSFIKNYIAITLQTTVMAIGIVFFSKLSSQFATSDALTQIATFFGTMISLLAIAAYCLKTPSFIRQTLGAGESINLSSVISTFMP